MYGVKPLPIFRKYDNTKYPAFFHSNEKYERISNRIKYLVM